MDTPDELSLVPPRRLGLLLREQRLAAGHTIDDLAADARVGLRPSELDDAEHGRLPLDDAVVARLAAVYGVDPGELAPDRSRLVIDLDEGLLLVGDRHDPIPDEATPQLILGRYLGLIQMLRAWTPGDPLPLRSADLEVLASSLGLDVGTVEDRLRALVVQGDDSRILGLRRRFFLPAAGLLVGSTVAGALVLVWPSGSDDAPATSGAAASDTAITVPSGASTASADLEGSGSAVAVAPASSDATTPAPTGSTSPAEPSFEASAPILPEAEIADAVEIEPGGAVLGDAVVVTPTAEPSTVTSDPVAAAIGAEAETFISYPWHDLLVGWNVAYLDSDGSIGGNTNLPTRTITVYTPADGDPAYVAEVLAHELGHALDVTFLDEGARQQWLAARGVSDSPWWPTDGPADFHVGAGDFAEAVAAVLTGSPSDSTLAGPFTAEQLALAESMLP